MEKPKQYQIPLKLLQYFVNASQETRDECDKKKNIETLGLIVGILENDIVIGKELYFPRQEATSTRVNNIGKCISNIVQYRK